MLCLSMLWLGALPTITLPCLSCVCIPLDSMSVLSLRTAASVLPDVPLVPLRRGSATSTTSSILARRVTDAFFFSQAALAADLHQLPQPKTQTWADRIFDKVTNPHGMNAGDETDLVLRRSGCVISIVGALICMCWAVLCFLDGWRLGNILCGSSMTLSVLAFVFTFWCSCKNRWTSGTAYVLCVVSLQLVVTDWLSLGCKGVFGAPPAHTHTHTHTWTHAGLPL